jgi:hypothetical protein
MAPHFDQRVDLLQREEVGVLNFTGDDCLCGLLH